MIPRSFARAFLSVCLLVGWVSVTRLGRAAEARPLNVVLMVADDLGAHDLGLAGSRFHETPNLDRLAREGVRFTQAYSACTVCSPTRAALMTGKYPARLKITDWIAGHDAPKAKLRPPVDWVKALPLSEQTLAERAKASGRATAHIGKWHLGGEGFGPLEQGFEVNLGGDHRGQPPSYFSPYGLPRLSDGPRGEYLTDREGAEAAAFIRGHREHPFFLQVAFHSVHTPLQAKAELVEKYRRKAAQVGGAQTNAVYAAMLESLDAAVGQVLKALDEGGLADRTVVIFTSDNGGLVLGQNPPTSNAPLRSGKGAPYEGGIRVPLLVRWPGVAVPDARVDQPVITMDVSATVAAAMSGQPTPSLEDGLNLLPLLKDPSVRLGREVIGWHYPHYHPGGATPYSAIRVGDWKLIQYYEDGRHELFDLAQDPGETHDLAASQPDRAMALARRLADWQGKVGAQWPMSNPGYQARPLAPLADGTVLLHSRSASVHGTVLRYEPMPFKDTLGWWARGEDWADWSFEIPRAGSFEVELMQGCGRGSAGSRVELRVGDQVLPWIVEETGHFQNFVVRHLGRITLAPGRHTLAVRPVQKVGGAVMDLRQIRLVPARGEALPTEAARMVRSAARIVVLGDSITYGGDWVEFFEAGLRRIQPDHRPEILNLGLPSETASGLSEEGHAGGAFPRPDVHERLGRVLSRLKPDLILACYGMNDGIYFPLDESRFSKFRDGIRRLHEAVAHEGVRVIHLTPPPFDPQPLKGRTLSAGLRAYPQPYDGYDSVLTAYSQWLVDQRVQGWQVVDLHGPMRRFLDEERARNPSFTLSGDGVHANRQGHWLMAREVLRALGASEAWSQSPDPDACIRSSSAQPDPWPLIQRRQRLLKDAALGFVGHQRPGMAAGKPWEQAVSEAREIGTQIDR
jgi:arylsulfatase A-like enzyme/lysophospholipase L1-like esterase